LIFSLSNKIPTLTLIGFGKKHDNFWVSFFLHFAFLASFLVATAPSLKKLSKAQSDYSNVVK